MNTKTAAFLLNTFVMISLVTGMFASPALAAVSISTEVSSPTLLQAGSLPVPSSPVLPGDNSSLPAAPTVTAIDLEKTPVRETKGNLLRPFTGSPNPRSKDTVLQDAPGAVNMPPTIQNFEGVSNLDGLLPPDTDGDVGPNNYIQMVNVSTAIYDKSGTLLYGPFHPSDLFPSGDPCRLNNDGDPVVKYDKLADRWVLSQFAIPDPFLGPPYYQCIAVSKTGTPTNVPADWWTYTFVVSNTAMNDYPKISVWPDAYYMTVNQFTNNASTWGGTGVFAFDRAAMLNGNAATFQYVDLGPSDWGGMLPADLDGSTPPPAGTPGTFLEQNADEWDPTFSDELLVYEFHVDWTNPANSTFTQVGGLPTEPFDGNLCDNGMNRNCIPQPGTGQRLDAIGDRLMFRLPYRNFGSYQALVANISVDASGADQAGIRWYELRKSGGSWSIYQQGTYAPDSNNRWMGSAAMDHVGNIALGYSVSSSTVFPSIRYAGRLSTDPLGTLPQAEAEIIAGSGSQTHPAARWGDYSAMAVDPVDDCTFWYTQEYIQTTGSAPWQTRIASFMFPNCTIGPRGTLTGTVTDSASSNPIEGAAIHATATITQTGDTASAPDGTYQIILGVGAYQVTASKFGYLPQTVNGVNISEDATTTQNFALDPAPTYLLNGKVTDATTGWPLYAKIEISGYPGGPIWTNPGTGDYAITLPASVAYSLHVTAFSPGYISADQPVGELSGDTTVDVGLQADLQSCTAPGYQLAVTGLHQTFNDLALPAGWSVINNGGFCDWAFDNPGSRANLTGGSGNFAIADSDACGLGTNMNTELRSPVVDVSSLSSIPFQFSYDYNNLESGETAAVDVSANGGSTWTNLISWGADQRGPATYSQDLTSSLAGSTQAQIRFRYVAPGFDWWWEVDNVFMGSATCAPQPGGLVVGTVADANTSDGLNGADVTDQTGAATKTVATPDDPTLGDGYYTVFSPAGTQIFTATMPLYSTDAAAVNVVTGDTVRQDFGLDAGRLSYSPAAITATQFVDESTVLPFTLTNNGNLPASFELVELDKGSIPFGPFERPSYVVRPFRQEFSNTRELPAIPPPAAPPNAAGNVLRSWPTGITAAWGIAFDGNDGTVWPSDGWGTQDLIKEFQPDGTATGRQWNYNWTTASGPADGAYNWNTGTLWLMNVSSGPENCIYEIDPASGPTGRTICPGGGFAISQRGLAYDPSTDTYFAGSWNDFMVHRFKADGTLLSDVNVGLAIAGLAYNPETEHLFVMTNTSPNPVYVLDVANNYDPIGQFSIPGFGDFSGAGLEISCDGTLWAVNQSDMMAYEIDSGETASLCARDVPWLSMDPITGTLVAQSSQVINVTLDATNIQPGIYNAQIKFNNDTPYDVPNAPVQMTANVPPDWGKLSGTVSTLGYCDANPAALADVEVLIEGSQGGSWTVQTDDNGFYQRWLPAAESPYTVSVSILDYEAMQFAGITIFPQRFTTQDFNLHLLNPCLTISPSSINVSLFLGQRTDRFERLLNSGAATGVYTMTDSILSTPPGGQPIQPVGVPMQPLAGGTPTATHPVELSLSNSPNVNGAPAKPWQPTGPIQLQLDDGSAEDSIGLTSGGQFIWLNRYTPDPADFPFILDKISLLMNNTTTVGSSLELLVYADTDGDGNPGTGATFLYSENVTVQFNDLVTWNDYTLATPVQISGPGDVLIGVVNRSGGPGIFDFPAAIDTTPPSQQRSWIGEYNGANPPEPPPLPAPNLWGMIDSFGLPGNWTLRGSGHTGTGADAPWLNEMPATGAVPPYTFLDELFRFDANSVPVPGEYRATAHLDSNDPEHPSQSVATTMNVTAPFSWGILEGTVTSLGYCDVNPAPLANATLDLGGQAVRPRVITTDENGHYLLWLDSVGNPYTLNASAAGHVSKTLTDITINSGGATTISDFTMRVDQPCLSSAPASFHVTVPWGGNSNQTWSITNTGAASSMFTITEQAGNFTPMRPSPDLAREPNLAGGPDPFGYTFIDSNELGGPAYSWVEIAPAAGGSGTSVGLNGVDDGYFWPVNLPFNFNFYGTDYNQIAVQSNGTLSFQNSSIGFSNSAIPSPSGYGVDTFIAHLWDDLYVTPGEIYYQFFPDKVVIEYYQVSGCCTSPGSATWEILLYTDGSILYQYQDVSFGNARDNGGSATIGIQGNATTGLQYSYNTPSLSDGLAICFAYPGTPSNCSADPLPWLTETPVSGTVAADGGSTDVSLAFDSDVPAVTQPGTYDGALAVATQDPEVGTIEVPVALEVLPPADWGKLNGTITGLGYCNSDPAPLAGAAVVITDTNGGAVTVNSDATGYYQYWLDQAGSPYSIAVTALEHIPGSASGISVTGGVTTTVNVDLRWAKACVDTQPGALAATLDMGASTTLPITLTNTGAADTDYILHETAGGFIPVAPTASGFLIVNDGGTNTANSDAMGSALTSLSYSYTTVSSDGITGIPATLADYDLVLYAGVASAGAEQDQLIAYLNGGGRLLIADNDLGFSTYSSTFYTTYLEASYLSDSGSDGLLTGVDIMSGQDPNISADPFPDNFALNGPDAVGIFTPPSPNPGWSGSRISPPGSYKAIYLPWDYQYTGALSTSIMERSVNWLVFEDVPWLSENPTSGTLAADTGTAPTVVTLDASVPAVDQPGVYYAAVNVFSADPVNNILRVPVTMTVNAPATWGKLNGTVTSLGGCDVNPSPLAGASVAISSTTDNWTLTTDAAGYYQLWGEQGTYTVTVSAAGYITSATVQVTVSAGATSTQNFDLRLVQPCMGTAPDNLTATVTLGLTSTQSLSIGNTGAGAGTFEIGEIDRGFTPVGPVPAGAEIKRLSGTFSPYRQEPGVAPAVNLNAPDAPPWMDIADYPVTIMDNTAAFFNGKVYSVGGFNGGLFLTDGFAYDTTSNSWAPIASMTNGREKPAAAFIDDKLYVVGGWDNLGGTSAALEIYDPGTNTWSAGAPAPNGYAGSTGVVLDGQLYVVGGCNISTCGFSNVYRYNPTSNSWSSVADYPEPISWEACATISGKIYCAGGLSDAAGEVNRTYVYDPGIDSWSLLANMLQTQWSTGFTAANNKLYISGGVTANFSILTDQTFVYDPATDTWAADANSNNALYRGASACGFYRIGGSNGFVMVPNDEVYPGLTDCGAGGETDVPWITFTPITGTVPADNHVPINVLFDAGQVSQPGSYYMDAVVHTDDPLHPKVTVPVTMTVTSPAGWGKLFGTVSSLGYCDVNPTPEDGAEVLIEGSLGMTVTVTTDPAGYYQYWMPLAQSPLNITVSADNHLTQSATGVVLEATTQHNVGLRVLEPCISITPDAMEVQVVQGYSTTVPFAITNSGAAGTEFLIGEDEANPPPVKSTQSPFTGRVNVTHETKTAATNSAPGSGPDTSGGPDPFGYTFKDSNESSGPMYDWIEIAPPAGGSGTAIGMTGIDDGYAWPLSLPFPFNFYGTDYTQMAVATNGTLYFQDAYLGFGNVPIPGDAGYGVNTFIANLWDDLYVSPGDVYYQYFDEMVVIEYYQVSGCCTTPDSGIWEILMFKNGSILFQYQDVDFGSAMDNGASATIGIQGDTATGLQYSYNTASLTDSLAICFAYPGTPSNCRSVDLPWLSTTPVTGTVNADGTIPGIALFDSSVITQTGVYRGELHIFTDDAQHGDITVPVTMTVVAPTAGVEISTDPTAKGGRPGTTVDYTVRVTNTGNDSNGDSFTLSFSGNSWITTGPGVVGPLMPGEYQDVTVSVLIPPSVVPFTSDSVTVTATSVADPTKEDALQLITTATIPRLFLPLIMVQYP